METVSKMKYSRTDRLVLGIGYAILGLFVLSIVVPLVYVVTASWGTTTRKGNTLYIHILSQKMPEFVTLPLNEKVVSATLFDTGEKVKYEKIQGGIVLYTANLKPSVDCIISLKLK